MGRPICQVNEQEEIKVDVLARLDELDRHVRQEFGVIRTLTAHYWPAGVAPSPRLVLAR